MSDNLTTKKIEEELAAVGDTSTGMVDPSWDRTPSSEPSGGYEPPMLTIVRHRTEPAGTDDVVRIELHQDYLAFETPGAVISFAESALQAVAGSPAGQTSVYNIGFESAKVSPETAAKVREALLRVQGGTTTGATEAELQLAVDVVREGGVSPDAEDLPRLERALQEAIVDRDECARRHHKRLEFLQALVERARAAAGDDRERAADPGDPGAPEDLSDLAQGQPAEQDLDRERRRPAEQNVEQDGGDS